MKPSKQDVTQLTRSIELLVSLMRSLEQKSQLPVTFQECQLIVYLGSFGTKRMNEIAVRLGIGMSNVTFLVDKLIEKGFVKRSRTESDRRVVLVGLTESGEEIFQNHRKQKEDLSRKILGALTKDEGKTIIELMNKVVRSMNREE